MDNFYKPEKCILLCYTVNGVRDYSWCYDTDDVRDEIESYKQSFGEGFIIDDVIEIGSCRDVKI